MTYVPTFDVFSITDAVEPPAQRHDDAVTAQLRADLEALITQAALTGSFAGEGEILR
jgi:phage tail sheath protein FI